MVQNDEGAIVTTANSVLDAIEELAPFPLSAIRVLELALGGGEPSDIAAAVAEDPGLTSKVLRLSNSARYAPRVPIDSIDKAMMRLGPKIIASLAMTTGCGEVFNDYGSSSPLSSRLLWEECLFTAFVARRVSQTLDHIEPELAYTVGLLQNIGHIVLDRFIEADRDEILSLVESGVDVLDAERRIAGISHAECGERLASKWGFPSSLAIGIGHHHAPDQAGPLAALCRLAQVAEGVAGIALGRSGLSLLDRSIAAAVAKDVLGESLLECVLRETQLEMLDTELVYA